MIEALARQVPTWDDDLRLIDSTPVPCAASRETVKRSELAGHAGYGYCRSHSRFFWGLRLYLVTTADGMPVTWCPANPKLGEREVMTVLLARDHHLIRAGQVILADKGFAGRGFEASLTEDLGVHLIRPDRRDEPVRHGRLARSRQWIEAVFDEDWNRLLMEDFAAAQRTLVAQPTWVIDGNYNSTLSVRLEACDTVVLMDVSTPAALWGIFSRQIRHGAGHKGNGVHNRIHWGVIKYVATYCRKMRSRVMAKIEEFASGHAEVVLLRSRRHTRRWLEQVRAEHR